MKRGMGGRELPFGVFEQIEWVDEDEVMVTHTCGHAVWMTAHPRFVKQWKRKAIVDHFQSHIQRFPCLWCGGETGKDPPGADFINFNDLVLYRRK